MELRIAGRGVALLALAAAIGVKMIGTHLFTLCGLDSLAYPLSPTTEEGLEMAGLFALVALLRRHAAISSAGCASAPVIPPGGLRAPGRTMERTANTAPQAVAAYGDGMAAQVWQIASVPDERHRLIDLPHGPSRAGPYDPGPPTADQDPLYPAPPGCDPERG